MDRIPAQATAILKDRRISANGDDEEGPREQRERLSY
jgi:hypothetical protein